MLAADLPAAAVLIVTGYLAGSIASAVLVCAAMGLPDPRSGGSGNPGATNVLRIGGKTAGALTLLGDVLKGMAPVLLGRLLEAAPEVLALTALAAFLGHLYPVFFGFKGGKGVATAFGALVALLPLVALGLVAIWLVVVGLWRYSSLAALSAAGCAAPLAVALGNPWPVWLCVLVIVVLLFWKHSANIERLRKGIEPKLGQRA